MSKPLELLKAFLQLNGAIFAALLVVIFLFTFIRELAYGAFPKIPPKGFINDSLIVFVQFTLKYGGLFLLGQWFALSSLGSYTSRWTVVLSLFLLGIPSTLYPAVEAYFLYWPSDPTTFTKEIAEVESWNEVLLLASCSLFWAIVVVYKPHKLLWQKLKAIFKRP